MCTITTIPHITKNNNFFFNMLICSYLRLLRTDGKMENDKNKKNLLKVVKGLKYENLYIRLRAKLPRAFVREFLVKIHVEPDVSLKNVLYTYKKYAYIQVIFFHFFVRTFVLM